MLRSVSLVRTEVSDQRIASIIRVKRIGELGKLAGISNRSTLRKNNIVYINSLIHFTLMMEAIRSSKISVLTRTTRRNILEDCILHGYSRENLKSYIALTGWAL
jgi:hypothetical protein